MNGIDYTKQNGNDVFDLVEVFSDHYDEKEDLPKVPSLAIDDSKSPDQNVTTILERMAALYQQNQRQESLDLSARLMEYLDQLQKKIPLN